MNLFLGQNKNAGKELATRGIYAVGIAPHDEGKLQFDRFGELSYDMLAWVCGDDYCITCNVSSPLFIAFFLYHMHYLYVTTLSHYHVLPTFTATAIEYMLSVLLREITL